METDPEARVVGHADLRVHPLHGCHTLKGFFPPLPQEADLDAEVENCHHFMPFAAAAYGWPLYIYRNPFTGLCRIGGDW